MKRIAADDDELKYDRSKDSGQTTTHVGDDDDDDDDNNHINSGPTDRPTSDGFAKDDGERGDNNDRVEYIKINKQRQATMHPSKSSPGAFSLKSSSKGLSSSSFHNNIKKFHQSSSTVDASEDGDVRNSISVSMKTSAAATTTSSNRSSSDDERRRQIQKKLDEMDEEPSSYFRRQKNDAIVIDTTERTTPRATDSAVDSRMSIESSSDSDNNNLQRPQQYPGAVSVSGISAETNNSSSHNTTEEIYSSRHSTNHRHLDSYGSSSSDASITGTFDENDNKPRENGNDNNEVEEEEITEMMIPVPNAHVVNDDNIQDAQILAVNVDLNEIDRLRALEQQQKETTVQRGTAAEREEEETQQKKKRKQQCFAFAGLIILIGIIIVIVVLLLPPDDASPTTSYLVSPVPSLTSMPTKSLVTITIAIQLDSNPEKTSWTLQCDNDRGLLESVPKNTYDNDHNRTKYVGIEANDDIHCTVTVSGIDNGSVKVFFGDSVLKDELLLVDEYGFFATSGRQINFLVVKPPPLSSSSPSLPPSGELGMVGDVPTSSPAPSEIDVIEERETPPPVASIPPPKVKVPIIVFIQLDEYSGETGWSLNCSSNENENVIVVPEGTYAILNDQSINETVQVTVDDDIAYCIFSITDSYADGLGDDGFYRVEYPGGEEEDTTKILVEGGGNFGFEDHSTFNVTTS